MPPTQIRIVGLGDSTTAGTPGFRSPLEAPPNGRGNVASQYAYWMMRAHPDWVVLNRGINGQRSDTIRSRFPRDVLAEKPHYVIILAGVNDIYQVRPPAAVHDNLAAMYDEAVGASIAPVAATVLPYDAASSRESASIQELNRWIAATSVARGILFCDTHGAVEDRRNPDRLASTPDGLHPDVAGYRRLGEALARTIEVDRSAAQ